MYEGLVRIKSRRACHRTIYNQIGEIFGHSVNHASGSVRYGVSFYDKDYEIFQCELEPISYREYLDVLKEAKVLPVRDSSFIEKIELWKQEEYYFEDDHINFYIPIVFDPYRVFGVYRDSEENDDYINIYVDWYPEDERVEMTFCFVGIDIDFCLDVQLTTSERQRLYQKICEECEATYGNTPAGLWRSKDEI